MSNMTKLQDQLNAIAEASDFPETLSTSDLKDKVVTLNNIRTVDVNGDAKYIGDVTMDDGSQHEAWLTGSKLHQQVEVVSQKMPIKIKITRGEGAYDPYLLTLA
tara:strand:- start:106 stop:417 length:312 start_codon:yes stop_codon:yes gene_type:complete